ncbi:hypothetical protein Tco_0395863 [Tanacetum coccineum]
MLTAPEGQEELIVYLAASKEAVSAVLMTEREAVNSDTGTSLIHTESHHRFFPVDTSLILVESHKIMRRTLRIDLFPQCVKDKRIGYVS